MGRIGKMLERGTPFSLKEPVTSTQKKVHTPINKVKKSTLEEVALELEWLNKIYRSYKSGVSNQFILVGNIYDFAFEQYRLNAYLRKIMKETNLFEFQTVHSYNVSEGFRDITESIHVTNENENEYPNTNGSWHDMTMKLRMKRTNQSKKSLFLVEYPQFVIPAGDNLSDNSIANNVDLHSALKSNEMITSSDMIIFIAETTKDINPMFLENQSEIVVIDIPYPNESQRLQFIEYLLAEKVRYKSLFKDITVEQFARMSSGLTLLNVENILMQADFDGELNTKMVFQKKKNLIRKEFGEIVEIFDSNGLTLDNFEGQEQIKQYHKEVIIDPILEGNTSIVPKGLLYVGPPGTGKTYFANCLAGSAKINFVEFKMSKILDVYVGQAEKNLERALKCFESLAPVGVFIDEIEQVLSRGKDGDNHVVKNIFSMFLSFLSNPKHRGKIIWIGATNYPNMLDEALKRPGRFDKKIPFFPPENEERVLILRMHLNKHNVSYITKEIENSTFVKKTEGYSQAEIENIVIKIVELMHRKKELSLTKELLELAIDSIKSSKSRDKIKEMIKIAVEECNDKEFLPEKYEHYLE